MGALIFTGAFVVDRSLSAVARDAVIGSAPAPSSTGVSEAAVGALGARVQASRTLMHGVVALVLLGVVMVGVLILRPAVIGIREAVRHLRVANAELDVALEEARDAARLKSEFLATMSHELRTPLNAVIGLSGLLMDTDLDERQRTFASTVNRSGDALLGLINNILDLSKIDAGKLELETTDFDLRELVETTAETFALRAEGGNVDLATYVTPTLPVMLRGDPGRVRQVLLNLVGNALKFTDGGSVSVRVRNVTGGRVRFEVTDTGIGIPADKVGKLFQPFAQVDASTTRRFGGTGLGLDISRRLVEMMHGTIGVKSVLGEGSTFFLNCRWRHPRSMPGPNITSRLRAGVSSSLTIPKPIACSCGKSRRAGECSRRRRTARRPHSTRCAEPPQRARHSTSYCSIGRCPTWTGTTWPRLFAVTPPSPPRRSSC